MLTREYAATSVTAIPNGSEKDLLGTSDGWDVANMSRAEFAVKNTGAVSLTVRVYRSPMGTNYVVDTTTYTVAAGASQLITLNPVTGKRVRLTAQAASSTGSAQIEGYAVRGSP